MTEHFLNIKAMINECKELFFRNLQYCGHSLQLAALLLIKAQNIVFVSLKTFNRFVL